MWGGGASFREHRLNISYLADKQPDSQSLNGPWNVSLVGAGEVGSIETSDEVYMSSENAEVIEVLGRLG